MRAQISGYANDLLSLGVDGFRLDAAKRMYKIRYRIFCIAYFNILPWILM